jgi:hypothetical protein
VAQGFGARAGSGTQGGGIGRAVLTAATAADKYRTRCCRNCSDYPDIAQVILVHYSATGGWMTKMSGQNLMHR